MKRERKWEYFTTTKHQLDSSQSVGVDQLQAQKNNTLKHILNPKANMIPTTFKSGRKFQKAYIQLQNQNLHATTKCVKTRETPSMETSQRSPTTTKVLSITPPIGVQL